MSASDTVMHLFPSCDPRGVLVRALAPDTPEWSTRPDALLFGWMLGLAPGIDSRAAAQGVLAFVKAGERDFWTSGQKALLAALTGVAEGRPGKVTPRRRKRR